MPESNQLLPSFRLRASYRMTGGPTFVRPSSRSSRSPCDQMKSREPGPPLLGGEGPADRAVAAAHGAIAVERGCSMAPCVIAARGHSSLLDGPPVEGLEP